MSRPVSSSSVGSVEVALPIPHFHNGANSGLNKFLAGLARSRGNRRRPRVRMPSQYRQSQPDNIKGMKAEDLAMITISYYGSTLLSITAVFDGIAHIWSYNPEHVNINELERFLADFIIRDLFDFVELEVPDHEYQPGEYLQSAIEISSSILQVTLCADTQESLNLVMRRYTSVEILSILEVGPAKIVVTAPPLLSEVRIMDWCEGAELYVVGVAPGAIHVRLQEVVNSVWVSDVVGFEPRRQCTGIKRLTIERPIYYGEQDMLYALASQFPSIGEVAFRYPDRTMKAVIEKALSKLKVGRIVPNIKEPRFSYSIL